MRPVSPQRIKNCAWPTPWRRRNAPNRTKKVSKTRLAEAAAPPQFTRLFVRPNTPSALVSARQQKITTPKSRPYVSYLGVSYLGTRPYGQRADPSPEASWTTGQAQSRGSMDNRRTTGLAQSRALETTGLTQSRSAPPPFLPEPADVGTPV